MKQFLIQFFSIIVKFYNLILIKVKSPTTLIKLDGVFLGILKVKGINNRIELNGHIIKTRINIEGNDNLVSIENGSISNLHIQIIGNNHRIIIQKHRGIVNTKVIVMDNANLIEIKEMTGIGGARIVIGGNENYIKIGKWNMIADNVEIWATDSHSILDMHSKKRINIDKPIVIKDHVWIGNSVKITKGVQVNNNSIIGMGSVVVNDVPENTISAGNPNKILKEEIDWCIERL